MRTLPGRRQDQTGQDAQRGGLARAVESQKPTTSPFNAEVEVVDGSLSTVVLRESLYLDHGDLFILRCRSWAEKPTESRRA